MRENYIAKRNGGFKKARKTTKKESVGQEEYDDAQIDCTFSEEEYALF